MGNFRLVIQWMLWITGSISIRGDQCHICQRGWSLTSGQCLNLVKRLVNVRLVNFWSTSWNELVSSRKDGCSLNVEEMQGLCRSCVITLQRLLLITVQRFGRMSLTTLGGAARAHCTADGRRCGGNRQQHHSPLNVTNNVPVIILLSGPQGRVGWKIPPTAFNG